MRKYDNNHVYGLRLHLWTDVTNGSIAHPPGSIQSWRIMVEWYRRGNPRDSSTRSLWPYYKQIHLVANQEECGERNDKIRLRRIFVHTSKLYFTQCKTLRHSVDSFISPPQEGVLRIFIALKNILTLSGMNARTLDPRESMLTIIPPKRHV
jgi:hypothetical protein